MAARLVKLCAVLIQHAPAPLYDALTPYRRVILMKDDAGELLLFNLISINTALVY
jgi:hypothetical protein